MDTNLVLADQGQWVEVGVEDGAGSPKVLGVGRGSGLVLNETQACFWLVVRGTAIAESQEGCFSLQGGDWLCLEGEARSSLEAGRGAVVLGLQWPTRQWETQQSARSYEVLMGRGATSLRLRRRALRRWRASAKALHETEPEAYDQQRGLESLFHVIHEIQRELSALVEHSPGRSYRRRRQVFARMQRACLYLEGHVDRAVRIAELAELSSFSVWYFTKTFHALYGEGPQAAASRMRMQHAARLLVQSRLSVGEVAAACGFENICSFSRAFRGRFGVPPSIYRQQKFTTDYVKPQDIHSKASGTFGP